MLTRSVEVPLAVLRWTSGELDGRHKLYIFHDTPDTWIRILSFTVIHSLSLYLRPTSWTFDE